MGEIKIPFSLKPENIMTTVENKIKKKKRAKRLKRAAIIAGIAAAAILALTVGVYYKVINYGRAEGSIGGLRVVRDYDTLYNYISINKTCAKLFDSSDKSLNSGLGITDGDKVVEDNMTDGIMNVPGSSGSMTNSFPTGDKNVMQDKEETDYSHTNSQTEGIDEGDIVKTDGEYIYVVKESGIVAVLKADGTNTKKLCDIDIWKSIGDKYNINISGSSDLWVDGLNEGHSFSELEDVYIYDGRLVAVASAYAGRGGYMTYAVVVTLQDGKAADIYVASQKGVFSNSRLKDGILYLVSSQYSYTVENMDDMTPEVNGDILPEDKSYYTAISADGDFGYYTMSSLDVRSDKIIDARAYMGSDIELYMSGSYIYFLEDSYSDNKTKIIRFSYDSGKIKPSASSGVAGQINDNLSADEYNGYLRIVTTDNEGNNLYVLDGELKTVGSITGLAKGERIKSSRFMGDMAYFVTYRNTDPLFAVDLSNPSVPALTDELKITGYSSYLHFLDADTLLGIGYESDPDTGITQGMKLTLFDVSDKADIKVKENIYYGDLTYSEAIHNYNAVMASDKRGLYGFCINGRRLDTEIFDDNVYVDECETYCYKVYEYKDGVLREAESIEKSGKDGIGYRARGLYAGDYFYLIGNGKLYVYSLDEVIDERTAAELAAVEY